ncbi:dnaJ homolog subfamily C member 17 [Haematobia irritans]|uniref:dnaJ homolog subfamily C member 17 n=1 Tax=Haematobia irritans TaxID=7368 RepID=UPI003F4F94D5
MTSSNKFEDTNLYDVLGVDPEASENEIRKAYRKKALACHPDKNPDNPKAAELFHELSKALGVLTDTAAKAAYDKVLKARKAAELRHQQLDSKRQKLKDDLLLREQEALNAQYSRTSSYTVVQKTDEELLREQIDRLRREGSRLLEEEQRLLREQLRATLADQAQQKKQSDEVQCHRLKIKWSSDKKDPQNGGYTEQKLMTYMKKYGDVVALVMSKKSGSAMIEFKNLEAAEMALAYEKGSMENPLRMEWVDLSRKGVNSKKGETPPNTTHDYEDLVMRKLRQAEERKRLIEQIQKEDELE